MTAFASVRGAVAAAVRTTILYRVTLVWSAKTAFPTPLSRLTKGPTRIAARRTRPLFPGRLPRIPRVFAVPEMETGASGSPQFCATSPSPFPFRRVVPS